MSLREKSAWITLVAIVTACLLYVLHVPKFFESSHWALIALLVALATFVVIEITGALVLRIAAYVYFVGSFLAMVVTVHLHSVGAHGVAWAVLLVFVLAPLTNYTARIVYYWRHA
jgi:hypothetical protein